MLSRAIATWGFVGYLRPAPGTWGSAAGLICGIAILHWLGAGALVAGLALVFGAGLWATAQMTAGQQDHDPSEIVVDEVVGQWIALLPVGYGAAASGAPVLGLWPGLVAAFVFFRLFDIWKPGPVGWADRRGDAMGVMLDDVIAGVMAALVVLALAGLAHGVLL